MAFSSYLVYPEIGTGMTTFDIRKGECAKHDAKFSLG